MNVFKQMFTKYSVLNEITDVEELTKMAAHWDGHLRESAVIRMGYLGEPDALPTLLIRINDWVPQVQRAACKAINRLMTDENAYEFLNCLPAIAHLQHCGRHNHAGLIEQVNTFLLKEANVNLLVDAIDQSDYKVARLCCDLVYHNNVIDTDAFIQKCCQSPDVLVRLYGSKLIRQQSTDMTAVILRCLKDSYMPIRREGFQLSIARRLLAAEQFGAFLFDNSPAVREIAVKHAAAFDTNGLTVYQQALLKPDSTENCWII